jgi:predicted nucleic acid-binding Zn ribbon protein
MKEGKTKQIDELVDQVLRNMGLEFKEHEVCMIWPEVVGQMIASRTKSVRVMDGKLFVSFTSAVVRNEIMMVKEGLIRALNEKVGKEVVKEMIIN